jgi:hypothetical protein
MYLSTTSSFEAKYHIWSSLEPFLPAIVHLKMSIYPWWTSSRHSITPSERGHRTDTEKNRYPVLHH